MLQNEKGEKSIGDKSLLTIDWKSVENFLNFVIDSDDPSILSRQKKRAQKQTKYSCIYLVSSSNEVAAEELLATEIRRDIEEI